MTLTTNELVQIGRKQGFYSNDLGLPTVQSPSHTDFNEVTKLR